MNSKGVTRYERNFNRASRYFKQWFENTLNKELVVIDGVEQYAVLQDHSQSNNKDLSDDKYLIVENSSNAKVGSIVIWRGNPNIIFTSEDKTIPTHKQFKTKKSNCRIKWMVGDKVSGNGEGHYAYVQNQTLYTLGVSTSGSHAWIVNAKMTVYMQNNEETRSIKVGQRIFINSQLYRVTFVDTVSRLGLVNFLLEQDFINPEKDNVELGIADYYKVLKDKEEDGKPTTTNKEVVINGSEKARIGSTQTYKASVFSNGNEISDKIIEWVVMDTENVVKVNEQDTESITIYIESNFKKVGSVITIVGKTEDGTIGSKEVRIVSPY